LLALQELLEEVVYGAVLLLSSLLVRSRIPQLAQLFLLLSGLCRIVFEQQAEATKKLSVLVE
jgi:hypothetical protein